MKTVALLCFYPADCLCENNAFSLGNLLISTSFFRAKVDFNIEYIDQSFDDFKSLDSSCMPKLRVYSN